MIFGLYSLEFRLIYPCLQFMDKYFYVINILFLLLIVNFIILARGLFNVPLVKSFSIRLR